MDIVGIDISKAKFDAALLIGTRIRHAAFSNTEAGFGQFFTWLTRHRPDPTAPVHACLEATGNWGLDLAAFLHGSDVRVSVVNPARIKAYGDSELARNKTDQLDAALIARFCRAQVPPAWAPPATHLRELRELVRRCDTLKAARVQELNRQKSGFASPAVATSITAHIAWLDAQIKAVMDAVRSLVAADPVLAHTLVSLRTITGFGEVLGLRVGTSVTEGTANFLVNQRMAKSQQMRWSRRGADLLLQILCALCNGALGSGFGQLFEPVPSAGPHWAEAA